MRWGIKMKKLVYILLIIIFLGTACQSDLAHRNEKDDVEIFNESMEPAIISEDKDLFTEKALFKACKSKLTNREIELAEREEALAEIVRILESKIMLLGEAFFENGYEKVYIERLDENLDREKISKLEDKRAKYYFYTLEDGFYKIDRIGDKRIFNLEVDYNELADYTEGVDNDCYEYVKLMGHVQNIQNKMRSKTLNFESIISFLNTLESYIKTYEDTYYSRKFMDIYKNFAYTLFLNSEYDYFSFRDGELSESEFLKLTMLKNENMENWIGEIANQILEFSEMSQNRFYYDVENYLYYYKAFGNDEKGVVESKNAENSDYIQIKNLKNKDIETRINEDIQSTMDDMVQRYQLIGKEYYQSTALSYVDENYMSVVYRAYLNEESQNKKYIESKTYDLHSGESLSLDEILENDLRQYKWILDNKIKARAVNDFNQKIDFYGIGRNQKYYLDSYGIVFLFENDDDSNNSSIQLYYEELDEIINNLKLRLHM